MNRPFPRFEVLGLTAALAFVGACSPNTSVKPGAPVLIELSIVEPGSAGPVVTTVTPKTGYCPPATAEGGACDPGVYPVCESATTNNLCRCVPNPAPPPAMDAGASDAAPTMSDAAMSDAGKPDAGAASSDAGAKSDASSDAAAPMLTGTWSCSFAPTSSVLYVFDRLLGTASLGDGGGATNLATVSPSTVVLNGDYASNGSPNEIIFPLLGDFRSDGPSILFAGVPALPTSTTLTVALSKTNVLAKDGRTPFTGTSLLTDGTISFVTQAFMATIATPAPPAAPVDAAADAAAPLPLPDMTPATVTFNNLVDVETLKGHITVTATPAPAGGPPMVDLASMDGLNVTITPHGMTTWPASSAIVIKVDAMTPDVLGDTLGSDQTSSFNTGPM